MIIGATISKPYVFRSNYQLAAFLISVLLELLMEANEILKQGWYYKSSLSDVFNRWALNSLKVTLQVSCASLPLR